MLAERNDVGGVVGISQAEEVIEEVLCPTGCETAEGIECVVEVEDIVDGDM